MLLWFVKIYERNLENKTDCIIMDKEQAEQLKPEEEKQKGKAAQAKPNWKR